MPRQAQGRLRGVALGGLLAYTVFVFPALSASGCGGSPPTQPPDAATEKVKNLESTMEQIDLGDETSPPGGPSGTDAPPSAENTEK